MIYIPKGEQLVNRKLWSGVIAAVLVFGTLTGCNTNIETSVPQISTENPALASISHSSSSSDTSSSKTSTASTSSTLSPISSRPPVSSSSSTSTVEKVDEKLMETLDGYEDFFKEYTGYIRNYKKEDPSKLQEYAKKSDELYDLLQNYDTDGFNKKEEIYYADVKYRVDKLLASVENRLPEWNEESGQYEMSTFSSSSRPVATAPASTPHTPSSASSSEPSVSSAESSDPAASKGPESSSEQPVDTSSESSSPESTAADSGTSEPVDVPEPDTSSLFTDYTRKWAYNQLDSTQKIIYARLFESAANNTSEIDVSDLNINVDTTTAAYWAFDYDNANFLTLGSGYSYSYDSSSGKAVSIAIDYGRSSGNVPESQFEATANSVIAEAQQMGSDYEQLKYVHDWIVNNTSYSNNGTPSRNEADGPVVYGQAVCEGYSKAFMYFAQSLGFECVCIAGYAGEEHMWNMVKLGGSWYHVDVTWDDPISSSGPTLRYDYFLISDSSISRDHSIDNYFRVPSAPNDYQQ